MDNKVNDWKGTRSDVNFSVNFLISTIEEKFSLYEKTAKKVFCESLFRNLVINEIYSMIDYLITGEINLRNPARAPQRNKKGRKEKT